MNIVVKVTPTTRSGFRFEHLAKTGDLAGPAGLEHIVGVTMGRAVQAMRERNPTDWQGYDYVVSFEEVK